MKLLFLGTGTSTGVPTMCCPCEVCRSEDPHNKRLRSSVLFQNGTYNLLVDTSTDLRQQCLRSGITHVSGVLYTHHHADHVHGIDELRCFNFFNGGQIPCYGNPLTLEMIQKNFSYIFNGVQPQGGGIPQLTLHTLNGNPLTLGEMTVTPIEIAHGNINILGYRVNDTAYITDCSGIPDASKDRLRNLDLLVLNALGFEPHATHFCLDDALKMAEELKPRKTLLTHINHKFDHDTVNRQLPDNVELAYDGMRVDL